MGVVNLVVWPRILLGPSSCMSVALFGMLYVWIFSSHLEVSSNIKVKSVQTCITVQINQPTRCNNVSSILLDIYLQLNMFRASSRPKHVEL
jgi:hypothetical protein